MTRVNRLFEALDAALAGGWLSRFRKVEQAQRIADLWAMKLSAFTEAQFEAGLRKCENFDRAPSLGEVLALFGATGQGGGTCAYVGEHGGCSRAGTISHGTTGGGPWYCRDHVQGETSGPPASRETIAANLRRAHWRLHERLQRTISEEDYVARGHDRALLEQLGLGKSTVRPGIPAYQREPGEDLFEGGEAA